MYEHPSQPLLTRTKFYLRIAVHVVIILLVLIASLALGMAGYHLTEGFSWIDSLLNASMILGGMGPVSPIQTEAGKLFASFYALFSGVIFLIVAGILFAPIAHRFLHWANLEVIEAGDDTET